jgi:hypothetical protein
MERMRWFSSRIPLPRHVWLVGSRAKGPTGKILKREIAPPVHVTHG